MKRIAVPLLCLMLPLLFSCSKAKPPASSEVANPVEREVSPGATDAEALKARLQKELGPDWKLNVREGKAEGQEGIYVEGTNEKLKINDPHSKVPCATVELYLRPLAKGDFATSVGSPLSICIGQTASHRVYGGVGGPRGTEEKLLTEVERAVFVSWGEAVNGLKGRLVVENPRLEVIEGQPRGFFVSHLEIQNVGKTPVSVMSENPFAIETRITDKDGRQVTTNLGRLDVAIFTRWVRVNPGETVRIPVSKADAPDVKKAADKIVCVLDTVTHIWELPDGPYQLSVSFSSEAWKRDKDIPADAWTGTLSCPAIPIMVLGWAMPPPVDRTIPELEPAPDAEVKPPGKPGVKTE